ncbi:MAG: Gfo/Idh/MocA family oxidoreductase [Bacteroidales bacterium]|nr:Gfo/Idh/MocA family oxidoreductase [Bacteroidales bacterium]
MIRRDFLKSCGLIATGVALSDPIAKAETALNVTGNGVALLDDEKSDIHIRLRSQRPHNDKPITVVIIGAGNRGRVYASYAKTYNDNIKVVGVSDIIESRCNRIADQHGVPQENRFGHYREVFERPKMADAVIIATPDDRHYEPCIKALELGYDVLLEKPVAPTEKECSEILKLSEKSGRIVAISHVLRYAPYFIALKAVVDRGDIGEIVSVQHQEPIEFAHMAHSYVRGNWRCEKDTTPIILAKSCHDLDIIRWIIGKPCKSISAYGSLHLFKKENMPEGAPARCTDGCPHQGTCPFSAIDIYVRDKRHLGVFDLKDRKDENEIMEKLRTNWYGRCVYQCDNDQPDHYVANMEFEGGVTSSFTMDAFTPHGGRRTRIMGTKGYIEGNAKTFTVWDFKTRTSKTWRKDVADFDEYKESGHGGGDFGLVRDFVEAVAAQDPTKLSSSIRDSIESHIMGFAAEKSRKSNKKVDVKA